jgi:prepilin-type processing-associated H-X9-DG protein
MTSGWRSLLRGSAIFLVAVVVSVGSVTFALREDARAISQCHDNLATLGLGLTDYHVGFDTFPCGTVVNAELAPHKRLSWLTVMMNWLEQGLQLKMDTTKAWDAAENRTPLFLHTSTTGEPAPYTTRADAVPVLICPAHSHEASSTGPRASDYVGVAGLGKDAATLPLTHSRAGVFGYNRATRLQDITDGASETLMIAETAKPQGPWTAGGRSTVRGLDRDRPPYLGKSGQFGGNHHGGAMVVFADGSVRMIRETIDPAVFESLSTIAGGEEIKPGSLPEVR